MELEFDPKTIDQVIQDHEIVIVKFSATWCGPCRALTELLEADFYPKYAKSQDVVVLLVDYDQHTPFCKQHNIDAVPCLKMWYNGIPVEFTSPVIKNGQPVMNKRTNQPKVTSVDKIEGFRPDMPQALELIIANLRANEANPSKKSVSLPIEDEN